MNGTGHGAHALLASALVSEGSEEPKHNERIIPIEWNAKDACVEQRMT